MSRKDLDEKLAEARRIIEQSGMLTAEVGAASFFLLQEVDRLRKIEDGLENLIIMRRQVREALLQDRDRAIKAQHYYGTNGAHDLTEKIEHIMAEVWPLEALLNGE